MQLVQDSDSIFCRQSREIRQVFVHANCKADIFHQALGRPDLNWLLYSRTHMRLLCGRISLLRLQRLAQFSITLCCCMLCCMHC